MIDWNNTPPGGTATIYLPAVEAADVLTMANRLYPIHKLSLDDAHTIRCTTGGITYVPIPPGSAVGYPGLLTVDVNASGHRGETFDVIVRQLTDAVGRQPPPRLPDRKPRDRWKAPRSPKQPWRRRLSGVE